MALHAAARQNNLDGVRQLLQAGGTLDALDRHIWTSLHLASRYGYANITGLLVEHDADINRREFHGWTGLHLAAREEHLECVRLLLEHGIDPEVCGNDGKRAGGKMKHSVNRLYTKVLVIER
ncbi:ankyrin repeat-containing domain protein [Aspergillus coremiiformis]|uniref:Ankyrin repeat-containing domain protein n=1 Tax=Aspergillus coremiiformis TaxID=138285 RepID=A0A5N6Z423_9EURO|nr:ankyrin repeat-containing domain protein [Aspergillus coremiiformis]